jgi:glycerate-2-kinase
VGNPDYEPAGDPQSGEQIYNLDETGKILVFGAGKGSQYVAKAIEDTLGDRLTAATSSPSTATSRLCASRRHLRRPPCPTKAASRVAAKS